MIAKRLISVGKMAEKSLHRINGSVNSTTVRSALSCPFSMAIKSSSSQPLNPLDLAWRSLFSGTRSFSVDKGRYERRSTFKRGIQLIVPEQEACVIEQFGKFQKVLGSGIHLLIPDVDQIAYTHTLRERVIRIPNQAAVTLDNISLEIDGVLFFKVVNPQMASYGVADPVFAVTQLAQTTMCAAVRKMTLDKIMERVALNAIIVEAINNGSSNWGLECLRYEIRDITLPLGIKITMDILAKAEMRKRARGKGQSEYEDIDIGSVFVFVFVLLFGLVLISLLCCFLFESAKYNPTRPQIRSKPKNLVSCTTRALPILIQCPNEHEHRQTDLAHG